MKNILNFRELINLYDGFIFDQFGVIHDGVVINPEIEKVISEIKNKNKKFYILSNSGKTNVKNFERISKMGTKIINFSDIVTSGDIFKSLLINKKYPFNELGNKYFIIGKYDDLLSDTQYTRSNNISDSNFLLLITLSDSKNTDQIKTDLNEGLNNNKKLVCVNPDIKGIHGMQISLSVGSIAKEYESSGGCVLYVGKPYLNSFNYILDLLYPIDKKKILMIGDSLFTDIKGAYDLKIDSFFISSGIHKNDFNDVDSDNIPKKILEITMDEFQPKYYCKNFKY